MMTKRQLAGIARSTGLNLYQQEKDYALKLFLFNYYQRYRGAVFKGGTCIKYLFGTGRFSEDLDFNIPADPVAFRTEVARTLRDLARLGMENGFLDEKVFPDAYTCEIWFHGPLWEGGGKTRNRNRFRIDAGKRIGLEREPVWHLIASEYPETRERFLVLTMDEREILVEKLMAMMTRRKGRDLYDVWFLLRSGIPLDPNLYRKKAGMGGEMVSANDYERDMKRLARNPPPYGQLRREVEETLASLDH